MTLLTPLLRPDNPHFSSGPCAKRPGYSLAALDGAFLSRSHRAKGGKAKLQAVIEKSKALLDLPDDWQLAILPGSDTGAVEAALWSLLGPRGVDVFAWDAFGRAWLKDIRDELKLSDLRAFVADYGALPDLSVADPARDCVFTWNGTTSGVMVPDANWIREEREGLVICDATSAAFALPLDFSRLDVVTWSWQKVLGGEAAHGMLALSPRAVARLESYSPPWPLPKLFRLTDKAGKLNAGLFAGETLNTPSLLAVEDALDGLTWAEELGGLPALFERVSANFAVLEAWVGESNWVAFLAGRPEIRSKTSVCLKIIDPWFQNLSEEAGRSFLKAMTGTLEEAGVAYDIASYRDAPPGLRIWAGATVEAHDLAALTPWLDWCYLKHKSASRG